MIDFNLTFKKQSEKLKHSEGEHCKNFGSRGRAFERSRPTMRKSKRLSRETAYMPNVFSLPFKKISIRVNFILEKIVTRLVEHYRCRTVLFIHTKEVYRELICQSSENVMIQI